MTDERMARVEEKVNGMEADISDIKVSLKSIADSLQQLAILEIKHQEFKEGLGRAFNEIKEIRNEVSSIKQKVLANSLVSESVVGGSKIIFTHASWLVFSLLSSGIVYLVAK